VSVHVRSAIPSTNVEASTDHGRWGLSGAGGVKELEDDVLDITVHFVVERAGVVTPWH
jgi:hypothetical protein